MDTSWSPSATTISSGGCAPRSAGRVWRRARVFLTNSDRVVNRRALIAILSDIFAAQPLAVWAARLDAVGIPNGPIHTVDQVVADAQTAALGIIQQMVPQSGSISLVGHPLSFDGARPPLAKLAPRLGEDNREILDPPA
jgi:crotonobetainyl-CoA:carnitine CoA-transferase CaiB-like acyl-CoA transferase